MSPPDVLFDLKNSFYLGNWQQALNEAQKVKTSSDEQKLERDYFMYRAYLGQRKYGLVQSEIRVPGAPGPLARVRLLAQYLAASNKQQRAKLVEEDLEKLLLDNDDDPKSALIVANIYYYEQNYEQALKVLNRIEDLECQVLTLQIYLKLDRFDLARKIFNHFSSKDEYATLAQLAMAWMHLYVAGEKLEESYYIFNELKEKFGPTPLLLNGQAACRIAQGKYAEAETLVQEAIEKDANYLPALINQQVVAQFSGKSTEVINRCLNQLRDDNGVANGLEADNPWLADFLAKERDFDRSVLEYR